VRGRLLALLGVVSALAMPALRASAAAVIDEPGYKVTSTIDWAAGTIAVEITHALDPATPSTVRAKGDAETDIEARLPDILPGAVAPLTVDSSHTYGELLGVDPQLLARVGALALAARRDALFLTTDFASLVARYTIPMFGPGGITAPLLPSRETAIRGRLGDVTTRKYTGVVIYAQGPLPEAGGTGVKVARPALFPRLWDEQMDLVLDKGMCAPEALARWGMVGYAQALDDASLLRAGAVPLRLAARAVFGDNATDLVLPTDGVRQLLALPENVALLREGRICIVYARSVEP
jgi:hypothetical protein